MRVFGVDMTSAPGRRKPIMVAAFRLDGVTLRFEAFEALTTHAAFDEFLSRPGSWIAGLDFPFGQARRFIETIGWPGDWKGYVAHVARMDMRGFVAELEAYKAERPDGDRQHFRQVDRLCGGASPQTLYFTPVGRMFFRAAPALLRAGVHVPGLAEGDRSRICVEAYPGVIARHLVGRLSYKNDNRTRQTTGQAAARKAILDAVRGDIGAQSYGLAVEAPDWLADDPAGDRLDAALCAVQAAWAVRQGFQDSGPPGCDPLEGWIADPRILN
ncbi:DUF429 domain-containing protein [Rhodovulum steppense]|uniref:Uncharacterized protein DUF429 n=1 Tax=Rhodovulum steppense TaxID=540251 RepID=A0A4R1Z356_9RHOB|nr:DUF429 domain-containing protein [Rhodovulum steppense]TCM88097.1 uncharacterized protein DUF429 [Rhodovulum steppense]